MMKGMTILDIVHRLSTVLTAIIIFFYQQILICYLYQLGGANVTGSCFLWSNSIIVQNGLNSQRNKQAET